MRSPVIFAAFASALMAGPAAAECKLTPIASGIVSAVVDSRDFVLEGQAARLFGIEPGPGAREALRGLIEGKTLQLELPGSKHGVATDYDRYGRIDAFARLVGDDTTVQEKLIGQGQARVSGRIGNKACADALLAAERAAREARRGLWADPVFGPLAAENLARLAAARGHFALVEGRVLSVRESGATIYVNFGRRWTRDFTVTVSKRQRRTFAAAGIDLDKLEGRRIRVRGFIEQRSGPIVEATAPEQIELID